MFTPSDPQIRPVRPSDLPDWLRMRIALWPEAAADDHPRETAEILSSGREAALVWQRSSGRLGGLVELSLRDRVDNCSSSPVAYVEGWYVDPDLRRHRVGTRLMAAAEEWARFHGCSELASDCLLENGISRQAHLAAGFVETSRQIHFKKVLDAEREGETPANPQ